MRATWACVSRRLGGAVDADHAARALLACEAGDHARLRAAGDRADDHRVEEHAELALLLLHLGRPAREAEAAERVVRRAGRDRVRLAAGLLDLGQRGLPARLDADAEAGVDEPHVRAQHAAELDVADAVVDDVRPLDPALLDQDRREPEASGDGGDLARVVGLHAADRDERVAALLERLGDEELELAGLVAAEGEPAVAVVALGPQVAPCRRGARSAAPAGAPATGRTAAGCEDARRGSRRAHGTVPLMPTRFSVEPQRGG